MRPPRIEHANLIADVLHYTSPRSGARDGYGQVAVIAVVGTLMAMGYDFSTASDKVVLLLPRDVKRKAIPESWRDVMLPPEGD